MGGYFSQETDDESPENEGYVSTPQISSFAKLFTLVNDPRSPGISNFSRTPILIQEPLVDPRSPANELVERTPLYDSSSAAISRYELDNKGYQFSPVVPNVDKQTRDNEGYVHSPATLNEQQQIDSDNTKDDANIENIHEDYDYEIIGEKNDEVCKEGDVKVHEAEVCQENKTQTTKSQLKKRFNATQKSFLKTVLFKPYEELSEDEINIASNEGASKRKPLGIRNDACAKGDVASAKKIVYEKKRLAGGRESSIYKLPLRELSLCDKENMA